MIPITVTRHSRTANTATRTPSKCRANTTSSQPDTVIAETMYAHLAPLSLVVAAGRAGQLAGAPGLYRAATGGYAGGLAVVTIVVQVTGAAMPVVPFVTPAVIAAVAVTAWRAGAWRSLAVRHMSVRAADARPAGGAW